MMSFCKKSVHSFLDLTNHLNISVSSISAEKPSCKCQGVCSSPSGSGLGFITGRIMFFNKKKYTSFCFYFYLNYNYKSKDLRMHLIKYFENHLCQ